MKALLILAFIIAWIAVSFVFILISYLNDKKLYGEYKFKDWFFGRHNDGVNMGISIGLAFIIVATILNIIRLF